MAENNIGSARVFLDVDATNWDQTLAQAKNAAIGFGREAEAAFDKSSDGVRRASARLLDYVASMGRADSQMERLVRSAARAGAERPVIDAAIRVWEEYQQKIAQTNAAMEEAAAINKAFDAQRAANVQQQFNQDYGVDAPRRSLEYLNEQQRVVRALTMQLELQEKSAADLANEFARAADEAREIDQAFNAQRAASAQQRFNQDFGVDAPQRDVAYREEQARVVRALTLQLELQEQAEAKLQAQQRAGQDYIKYLQNLKDSAGKTHYEILRLKAAQLGLGQEGAKLVDEIEAQDRAMTKGTITTKQYEWAMRGLPAQFTDIFTSLAAGQNPMLVLLQQGGQIKDMFGGVVPALSAVGGAALKMINPLTVGLAVLGSFALAAYKGSQEATGFGRAIIESGDAAGMSVERYNNLARAMDSIAGVTRSGAAAALSEVGGVSQFTASQIALVADTAERMRVTTGRAISETVDEFKELGKDPVAAVRKLDEQHAFLSNTIYEQIIALQNQGRQQEAATLAMETYARTMRERTQDIADNLGWLEEAWRGITGVAKEAWDAMLDVGREETVEEKIAEATRKIANARRRLAAGEFANGGIVGDWQISRLQAQQQEGEATLRQIVADTIAADDKADAKLRSENARRAQNWLTDQAQQYRSDQEKLNTAKLEAKRQYDMAYADAAAKGDQATLERLAENYAATVQGLEKKYADKSKKPSGRDATQAIRDQAAMELAMLQTQTRQVQAQYELREISVEDYYSKLMELARQERDVQLRSNEAQVAALAGTKDEQRQVSQLRAASARAEQQYAQATIDLETRKTQAVRAFQNQQRAFDDSLADRTKNLQREMQDMAATVGMGDRQAEIARRQTQLYREQADQIESINREVLAGNMLTEEGERRTQAIREETISQLRIIEQGYKSRQEAEENWINGVLRAFENLRMEANGYADLFDTGITNAVNGAADAVVEFSQTGEFSLDSLAKSVGALITRFLVLRAIMSGLNAAFPQYTAFGQANGIGAPIQVGGQTFAKGGVPNVPSLSAYVNKIVDRPTFFAKGGVPNNVMGEAGKEGIFPLKRDSQGRLGVIAAGSSDGKVIVNIHGAPSQPQVQSRQTDDGTTIDILFDQFESRVGQRIAQGSGPVYSATKGRFQVKDRS